MKIIWHGHSCFELVEQDYHIVIDPFQAGSVGTAFPDLDLEADEVLVTHEHRDHNGRECVRLRSGRTSPFTITEFQGAHDFARGRLRGPNTIFLIEANGVRVAHFGDQGGPLMPDQKKALKDLEKAKELFE
jgi:L-ascorbate metabolism protein UlaG (beta-lactamase superfamily)